MTTELGRQLTVTEAAQSLRPHLRHYLAFEAYTQSPDIGVAPESPPQHRIALGAA
jgi:hypothetical protein